MASHLQSELERFLFSDAASSCWLAIRLRGASGADRACGGREPGCEFLTVAAPERRRWLLDGRSITALRAPAGRAAILGSPSASTATPPCLPPPPFPSSLAPQSRLRLWRRRALRADIRIFRHLWTR